MQKTFTFWLAITKAKFNCIRFTYQVFCKGSERRVQVLFSKKISPPRSFENMMYKNGWPQSTDSIFRWIKILKIAFERWSYISSIDVAQKGFGWKERSDDYMRDRIRNFQTKEIWEKILYLNNLYWELSTIVKGNYCSIFLIVNDTIKETLTSFIKSYNRIKERDL